MAQAKLFTDKEDTDFQRKSVLVAMKKSFLSTQEKKDGHFVKYVLKEYKKHGRFDLPWRKQRNAYRILVSEIMLQQTQVSRVLPKFSLWMKTYPTLSSLSSASLRDVLLFWKGLGYQRRAKSLLEISHTVKVIPRTFSELMILPGVGTYTASAVCAFAYNTFEHPLLETNIRTALIEYFHKHKTVIDDAVLYEDLFRLEKHPLTKKTGACVWYYALMDYGAQLKANKISHNKKSKGHAKQSSYKGSFRELRAKVLFAITSNEALPKDSRVHDVLRKLEEEGYIKKKGKNYTLR
ncbi:MAG: A/G-specific adenine glycosylase [Patescibacteria group bacterium]|nr:A/G-specific adenine glycosylase [Patescibacteria group bacterium]